MSQDKRNLLIIFGGISPEHEVSCYSAASVLRQLDPAKYNVLTVGIRKDGSWLLTGADPEQIESGEWDTARGCKPAVLSPDRVVHGLQAGRKTIPVDVVFPVLHGEGGEDGKIQGLLEMAGIPYVGCGPAASVCGMDKTLTKLIVSRLGIRQAKHLELDSRDLRDSHDKEWQRITMRFHGVYPLFVKPARTGSSVGVSKVSSDEELERGLRLAAAEDSKILIEEAIVGREMEVAVLGNHKPEASPIGEILPAAEFYDYDSKYGNDQTQTVLVTDLPPTRECEMKDAALNIYRSLGCRGLARVDFFLAENGDVVFNEINTMPGFTGDSMYPQLWEAAGIEYPDLLDRLIELALEEE
ncbi:MAG: D-alanine--D-alanine ligase family protein [Anaerovoracaceae bacterium]|jgi:D-alanine-D-alanine ligase